MAREMLTVLWAGEVWGCPPASGCESHAGQVQRCPPDDYMLLPSDEGWGPGSCPLGTWKATPPLKHPTASTRSPSQTSVTSLSCSLCLECLPCVFWAKSTYLRHSSRILSSAAPALSIRPPPWASVSVLEPNTPWSLFYLC